MVISRLMVIIFMRIM